MRLKIILSLIAAIVFYLVIMSGRGLQVGKLDIPSFSGEGKIFGRLAESARNGVFSSGGLPGWCIDEDEMAEMSQEMGVREAGHKMAKTAYQIKKYYFGIKENTVYTPYFSQSGLQALIYYFLDQLWHDPLVPRSFCAIFLSAVLVMWLLWVESYFGFFVSIFCFFGILTCARVLPLGDNVAHVTGSTYLIIVALLWALPRPQQKSYLGRIVYVTVLTKLLLSGAEFLFASLLIPFVPVVFYAALKPTSLKKIMPDLRRISAAILLACFTSLGLLLTQVSFVKGSLVEALAHFSNKLSMNILFHEPRETPWFESMLHHIRSYLNFTAIKIASLEMTYLSYILLLFVVTLLAVYFYRLRRERLQFALLLTTWSSLLCPLAWIFLGAGHTSTEKGTDQTVWNMPFTLFGLLLIGVTLQQIYREARLATGIKAKS